MDKKEIAYWAGLFDGEGCIKIDKINRSKKDIVGRPEKRAWRGQVEICGCYYPTMNEFHEKFKSYLYIVKYNGYKARMPLFRITMWGKEAENFLKLVYPYLKIKKDQAANFLAFRKTFVHPYSHGSKRLDKKIENKRWKMFNLARSLKRVCFEPVTTERRETSLDVMPQSELQGKITCREKSEAISPLTNY